MKVVRVVLSVVVLDRRMSGQQPAGEDTTSRDFVGEDGCGERAEVPSVRYGRFHLLTECVKRSSGGLDEPEGGNRASRGITFDQFRESGHFLIQRIEAMDDNPRDRFGPDLDKLSVSFVHHRHRAAPPVLLRNDQPHILQQLQLLLGALGG